MSKKKSSKPQKILNTILSFVLAFLLFLLSAMLVLKIVIFSENSIMDALNDSGYLTEKNKEITQSLTDLGYASGLDESFFDGLIENSLLYTDTSEYINNFYSGKSSVVDTTSFKEMFNTALDNYIAEKQIDPSSVNTASREYLVNNAAKIYKNSLELPLFQTIAGYFLGVKNAIPIAMIVDGVLIILICIIIIFSSKWKHRPFKYLCYSTATTFLTTLAPAVALLISGKIEQFNIASQATYKLFVTLGNQLVMTLIYFSAFFAILAVAFYILYRYYYPKHTTLQA